MKNKEKGNWYNSDTGEKIHPDREHKPPVGPHDDYTDASGKEWRVFPDGSAEPRIFNSSCDGMKDKIFSQSEYEKFIRSFVDNE